MLCVFASDAPTTTKRQARTKHWPLGPNSETAGLRSFAVLVDAIWICALRNKVVHCLHMSLVRANTHSERQVNMDTIGKLADARMGKVIQNNLLRRYRTLTCFPQPLARRTTDATRYREPLNNIPANHHSPLRRPHLFDPCLERCIKQCGVALHLSFNSMSKKLLMLELPWKKWSR